MVSIHFEPVGITVQITTGQTLLDGIHEVGFYTLTPCGGMGTCGDCRVQVDSPEIVPPTPHKSISKAEEIRGVRLACQAVPKGDVRVQLSEKFLSDSRNLSNTKIHTQSLDIDYSTVDPAAKLIEKNGLIQLRYDREQSPVILKNWHRDYKLKGLAIDIGTTTIAISMICLTTGKTLDTASTLNPQTAFGYDILTRIRYANTPQKQKELACLVQDSLNSLLHDLCAATGSQPDEIVDICVGANTTMLQLAAGMDSAPLGKSPFSYDIKGGSSHPVSLFDIHVNKAARIYLPPILHAFIGTDISSGLTLCPEFFNPEKIVLFIDIGTNGEICLNVMGKWYAVSTAAGPAFEGMGISSGMRAENGAIEHVEFHNGKVNLKTIGNIKPKGICGSGIIDLVAELLTSGCMDKSGRLIKKPSHERIIDINGVPTFECRNGIYFTQKDIRQIQLAVSAIRTGIDFILEQSNINKNQIDIVYLAGGFGAYLKIKTLSQIGIFSDHMAQKTITCGNTSLHGAITLLVNRKQRDFLENALSKVTYLSLAEAPGFNDAFIANLNFTE